MALIKCPECGREKVSDSAERCPDCGYGIKAHFKEIEFEEQLKLLEQSKKKILEKYSEELESEIKIIREMPYPKKPNFMSIMFCKKITYLHLGILICLLLMSQERIFFQLIFVLDLLLGNIAIFIYIHVTYKKEMSFYKYTLGESSMSSTPLKWKDFEGYKEFLIEQKINYYLDKENIHYS